MTAVHRDLLASLAPLTTLRRVLDWATRQEPKGQVANAIAQDEFTHDVVVRLGVDLFVVFDTT